MVTVKRHNFSFSRLAEWKARKKKRKTRYESFNNIQIKS